MIKYENDCVNCVECVHCGANEKRTARIYCDKCGGRIYHDDVVYAMPDYPHLCADCVLELVPHKEGETLC